VTVEASPRFVRGDANADGAVDVIDPIAVLDRLFLSGPPPAAPFPACGAGRASRRRLPALPIGGGGSGGLRGGSRRAGIRIQWMVVDRAPKGGRMAEDLRRIIEAAKGGDRAALERLGGCADRFIRIFSGRLSRRVRRARGSTVDFVLEGLGEALAHLPEHEYRSDEAFYAWAASHIRSKIIDAHRAEAREKRGGPEGIPAGPEGEMAREPAAEEESPSQAAASRETLHALGSAILAVQVEHPREMEAVVLKVFEGCSFPEIGDRLSLGSEKRARLLFARGIDLLRPRVRRLAGSDDRPGLFPLDLGEGGSP
jgi:RNA polymerase sigma factor (sigma-70 family)